MQDKAKVKVFHIQPEVNLKAFEAVESYLAKLESIGLTNVKVAMHGAGDYGPDSNYQSYSADRLAAEEDHAKRLRAIFRERRIPIVLDEVAGNRQGKYTSLGAVIEFGPSSTSSRCVFDVRFVNEVVAPQMNAQIASAAKRRWQELQRQGAGDTIVTGRGIRR